MRISSHDVPSQKPSSRDPRRAPVAQPLSSWKQRFGAAALGLAASFGGEGCATTDTASRNEARSSIYEERYGDSEPTGEISLAECARRAEEIHELTRTEPADLSDQERRLVTRRLSHAARSALRESAEHAHGHENEDLFSLSDVEPTTATLIQNAQLRTNQRDEADANPGAVEPLPLNQQGVSFRLANRIVTELAGGRLLTSFSAAETYTIYNGATPREVRFPASLSRSRDVSNERMNAIAVAATADFVRAYVYALELREAQNGPTHSNHEPSAPINEASRSGNSPGRPYTPASITPPSQRDNTVGHRHHRRRP